MNTFIYETCPICKQDHNPSQTMCQLTGKAIPVFEPVSSDTTNPKDLIGLKKVPLRLIPAALMIYVAKVMALGARKYSEYNWRSKKVRQTVYLEAAMRHLLQVLDGQDNDEESGMPHEAHVAACMAIILDARACGCLIDDRPIKGAAARLLDELTEKI